ncbi:hypothetical protein GWK47_002488 [Chionoecetes opilio]|uniref:Tesmin/TSO1-like CXC domain-containing protein n=1 Tax=Chionoecetes opilio TaxID=41210 RepID=A0A8J5CGV0_CHIOP|nr:hypothetical protein GWK47_002488 [Chionoecetes opilio]
MLEPPSPATTLPPTDANLLFHMLRAHHQTMLWKAADQNNDPKLNITEFGWEVINNVPTPEIASGPPAPPELMKVISCQCRAARKACLQANCSCCASGLSCTVYYHCEGSPDECHNPMMKKGEDVAIDVHEDGTGDDDEAGVEAIIRDDFLDPLEY